MKISKQMLRASVGILLLLFSLPLSFRASRRYAEKRYVVDAASCRMNVLALQPVDVPATAEADSVVLFHGIAANGMVMQYLARSFAELGLRVYVPDLPGHGHSPGPFTPELAESCSASLVRGLAARGMLVPERTILAGHSMGGAIALRIAEKTRPAGVIAISPAPMQLAHGVEPQNLLFHGLPQVVPNTRIIVGQYDLPRLVDNASDLAASAHDSSVAFSLIPHQTHVSVLFSPSVAAASQAWAMRVLSLKEPPHLPSRTNLIAALLGFIGILLVAGPFLRDVLGKQIHADVAAAPAATWWRAALEIIVISLVVVILLRYWIPLRFIHLFEGDYLASFFLVVGAAILALHPRAARHQFLGSTALVAPASSRQEQELDGSAGKVQALPSKAGSAGSLGLLLGSVIAAFLLHFLVTSWFELTVSSAWLTLQRWVRFPVFLVAAFCFLYALELLVGPVHRVRFRYFFWLLLIALAWHSLAFGVLHLRSGEILLVLLSPYFLLQFLLAGTGVQLVRRLTGSPTAAAMFGAILLAGFCLVLFPVS